LARRNALGGQGNIRIPPAVKFRIILSLRPVHVNIILFRREEVQLPLSRRDPRAVHLLATLRRRPGESFDAGIIDGPRGRGTLAAIEPDFLRLAFSWEALPPPLWPIHLVVGLPRPSTARDILREATTLGVSSMHFVRTDRGESSYGSSSLWASGLWRECVINGAAQAFCTRLPEVRHGATLAETIAGFTAGDSAIRSAARLALDNYEAPAALDRAPLADEAPAIVLALGAERGWSDAERRLLRRSGFAFAHLGARVLRTETACIAAVTLLKSRRGWL
jgi:RsmE family RNA methyltransferase